MAALISTSLCASPALALDWDLTPTLNARARLTDNVNQSADNPESALILSVTPGFSLLSKGSRRVQARLRYGLTGVTRIGGDNNSNDLNHNLSGVGKAELVEDFLFIDGSARISQQLISLLGSPADADTNSSNRATVGTYSLSPYIQKRLGTFATALARVTHSGAIFGDNAGSNITANTLTASLNSGTRFNDINWAVNYYLRQAEYGNSGTTGSSSSTFESTSATLGYALTRKFRVFGTVGQDSNDFINASQSNGNFYTAGFGWSPTRRTSLEASAGKRFLGKTYSLSLLHRSQHSNWNIRYSENVSDISRQFLQASNKIFFECPSGSGQYTVTEAPGCSPITAGELSLIALDSGYTKSDLVAGGLGDIGIARGIYILKSLTGGVTWTKGKLGTGLSVFERRRNFLLQGNIEDRTRGIVGNMSYRLSPHTFVTSTLALTNIQIPASLSGGPIDRDDNLYTASLGLNHRFDPKLSGVVTLRHRQRDSNDASSSYGENSITASVLKSF